MVVHLLHDFGPGASNGGLHYVHLLLHGDTWPLRVPIDTDKLTLRIEPRLNFIIGLVLSLPIITLPILPYRVLSPALRLDFLKFYVLLLHLGVSGLIINQRWLRYHRLSRRRLDLAAWVRAVEKKCLATLAHLGLRDRVIQT